MWRKLSDLIRPPEPGEEGPPGDPHNPHPVFCQSISLPISSHTRPGSGLERGSSEGGTYGSSGGVPFYPGQHHTDVNPLLPTMELPLPELRNGTSEVLQEDHIKELLKTLPARAEGYSWTLLFSTSKHGFSLNTLYREMTKYETPVLLVIQDTTDAIFGAVTSCPLRQSEHFYGTGETFLFTFYPEFFVFPWTGENLYFMKGNQDSLSIGAGDGIFGLWLDGDLNKGRTYPCETFANMRLTKQEDFIIKHLECWGFI